MIRHPTHSLRWLVLVGFVLGCLILLTDHAFAFPPGAQRSFVPRPRLYTEQRYSGYRPLYRPYYRHRPYAPYYRYRPYSPYYRYRPYYPFPYYPFYDYYGYYDAYPLYQYYTPGVSQSFPAFKLPGFFQYPGAIGKGEDETQALQADTLPNAAEESGQDTVPPESPGR